MNLLTETENDKKQFQTSKDNIKFILHDTLWSNCRALLSFIFAKLVAISSTIPSSSRFNIESIPSSIPSAPFFVRSNGWSHIFFNICPICKSDRINKSIPNERKSEKDNMLSQANFRYYRLNKFLKVLIL